MIENFVNSLLQSSLQMSRLYTEVEVQIPIYADNEVYNRFKLCF